MCGRGSRRRALAHAILGAAALAFGCRGEPGDLTTAPRPPAEVVTAPVGAGPLVVTQRYLGEVWATSEASLAAEEPGRVRRVHVVEGDRVEAGDLLVELDDRLAEASVVAARAEQKRAKEETVQAKREKKRFALLAKERVATELEAEQKRSAYLTSRAEETATGARADVEQERLRRHRIVAPFGGVVSRRLVDPGDWMSVGMTAVELVDVDGVEVLTPVPAGRLAAVTRAREVRLRRGDEGVTARLGTAVNAVDRETRTALIRFLPNERPPWLLPGMAVDVRIEVEADGGLVVPLDAVTYGVADDALFRVRAGKAERIPVEVLEVSADRALVSGKIALGDRVVVRGNERLMPGQPVKEGGALAPPGAGAPPNAPPAPPEGPRGKEGETPPPPETREPPPDSGSSEGR